MSSILMVPSFEEAAAWPTLGPQVCARIEAVLVHGPGDFRGQPARIDDEKRALIYRLYEVYPREHQLQGRRRFKRAAISLRKGSAKTELAAWIAAVELDPEGPVRCTGWRSVTREGGAADWEPIGGPVTDPYIPLLAYTEGQSEELPYGALRVILEKSQIAHLFDIGLNRVMRVAGDGKAEAIATAPNAADGARTTFQVFEETHRFTLDRHRQAHQTMLRNTPKRFLADAWSLETTTAFVPGENSVAEATMDYAKSVAEGRQQDSRLFFFHRQASDHHDLSTPEGVRAAVLEASGPGIAVWSDIDSIAAQFNEPDADPTYLERVWLNRPTSSAAKAFDFERWKELAKLEHQVPAGALIVIGFDGSRYYDATGMIGTEIDTGFQFRIGIWERPPNAGADYGIPEAEVDQALRAAMRRYRVWRVYADPPYWEAAVAKWAGDFGEETVMVWPTNRYRKMADAVRAYRNAQKDGELSHDGDAVLARHIGNAHKRVLLGERDDEGKPLYVLQKARPDSPDKIDGAVAGTLSWEARRDALVLGVGKKKRSKYEDEEPRVLDVEELQAAEERERLEVQRQAREAGA